MARKPLHELVLDKMEEKIPMVISSDLAESELRELGKMLCNASGLAPYKHSILARIHAMSQKLSPKGDERRAHKYLEYLELTIQF